jgi:Na+/H+ antiporter NhaD/arsenite permease-like protein
MKLRLISGSFALALAFALPVFAEDQAGQGSKHEDKSHDGTIHHKLLRRGAESGYRNQSALASFDTKITPSYKAPAQKHEFLVIDNVIAWNEFWRMHAEGEGDYRASGAIRKKQRDARSMPEVDFKKNMVVVLFAGRQVITTVEANAIHKSKKNTGIYVRKIMRHGDQITVYYSDASGEFKSPEQGTVQWTLANPYTIVQCKRINGTVAFSDRDFHHSNGWVTLLFGLLLTAMILCLALEEKLHAKKSIITGTFAIISLFLGDYFELLPIGPLTNMVGENLGIPVYVAAVDWEVIAIILASSLFVDVTSKSGIFTWIAIKLTKQSGGDPLKLLIYYGAMTVIFSAVLNNVTAMIIVGSLTGVSLRKLDKKELLLGFLLIEGLLTNIGGLLTLISSVPNIIVGNTAGISFLDFFINAAPYVVFSTIVTLVMGAKFYKILPLSSAEDKKEGIKLVQGFDENDGIKSAAFFNFSASIFILFILILSMTSNIPVLQDLKMGYVAFAFATIMLCTYRHDVDKFYAKVDWDLIGFFATLFIVINVMEHAHVLAQIGKVIGGLTALGDSVGAGTLLWGSAVASSVTDNIPLAAMLAKILDNAGTSGNSPFWWSVIFGANLGGNLTPIGSASTVVAVTVMAKNDVKLSFLAFVKAAFPFAFLQLILATVYVLLLDQITFLWILAMLVLGVIGIRAYMKR